MIPIRIPVYRPDISGNEAKYIIDCIQSTWISSKGKYIGQFEAAFQDYVGSKYSATTSNGTTALQIAVMALGLGPGDEVLVPSLTYIASVNPIRQVGATPVFVDSSVGNWNMDHVNLEKYVTSKTKALMAVHLYGVPCDMTKVMRFCRKYNLLVIEDCAEALGSFHGTQHVGTFGDIGTFSFFGNKTITTGEGGMVITNDRALNSRITAAKGQGLAEGREYWHDSIGFNYRMTNICAAIGAAQMERIADILARKAAIDKTYRRHLLPCEVTFQTVAETDTSSCWMTSATFQTCELRDRVRKELREHGIETRPIFYPINSMPMYKEGTGSTPVAEDISCRGINFPSWPELSKSQLEEICDIVRKAIG